MEQKNWKDLKKDIHFSATIRGMDFVFSSTWGIFSPREIDEGSAMLLETLDVAPQANSLDLGCGYGAIGIPLAKLTPQGRVLMVDTNVVAVEYAKKNIIANQLKNADAILSNGFSDVPDTSYDLIVSNIPAKVGNELLTIFLHDAKEHLAVGGTFTIVTIAGLREYMKRQLTEVFGNYKKVKQGKTYTVASAERTS
ncbi:class I SAM-dependent methyltransferase [Patescibacteria group bacterium]|nr:class I SAM-dependent methyltransferase [Patescibacteria group bacterium]